MEHDESAPKKLVQRPDIAEVVDATFNRAILRLAVVLVAALFFETGLAYSVVIPGGVDIIFDCLARAGRIASLGLPLFALLSVARRWRPLRNPRIPGALKKMTAWWCAPRRALPLVTFYLLLVVVFTPTLASGYDLAWRVAGVFALVPLGVAVLGLIVYTAMRQRRSPSKVRSPNVLGRALWTAVAAFLIFFIFPRIVELRLLVIPTLIMVCIVAPLPLRPRRSLWFGVAVVILTLSAGAGVVIDAHIPSVRRLSSVYTPVSNLGLQLLLAVTDVDFDGSSGALGLDCDDMDGHRSPTRDDLPDDGIDQNCTGRDSSFVRTSIRFKRGGPRWTAPPDSQPDGQPDVVLVTVDALRHDAIVPRRGAALMPGFARYMKERCVFFDAARANNNYTSVSLMSLMSGTLPRHIRKGTAPILGVPSDAKARQPAVPPSMASTLKTFGYDTAAVVALDELSFYQRYGVDRVVFFEEEAHRDITAETVLGHASKLMRERSRDRPFYLWVHLLDAHAPYSGGMSRDDYDRTVRSLDVPLTEFLSDLSPETVVIVTADHGETFGEHGTFTHGNTLFDEEVRVPLALCAPEASALGSPRVVETPVGLIDVAPTVFELVGAKAPYPRHGESLVPHLRSGASLRSPWVVMEEWIDERRLQGLVLGDWKWIRDHDLQWEGLFNVREDPGERREVSSRHPEEFRRLRALFYEILDDDLDTYRTWRVGRRERPLPRGPEQEQ